MIPPKHKHRFCEQIVLKRKTGRRSEFMLGIWRCNECCPRLATADGGFTVTVSKTINDSVNRHDELRHPLPWHAVCDLLS